MAGAIPKSQKPRDEGRRRRLEGRGTKYPAELGAGQERPSWSRASRCPASRLWRTRLCLHPQGVVTCHAAGSLTPA